MILLETKIDESFPDAQFKIEGYSGPYRSDRNINGEGVAIYVKERFSNHRPRKFKLVNNFEGVLV